ncbi:MAG TPA: hypothetical protein VH643_35905 [Gemmataceae bacterium]|jgi:hypothetical protein
MRFPRLVHCLLYPILLLTVAPGCQSLHVYRPVTVLVRDAETKKPIPDAEVHFSYPMTRDSLAPYNSSSKSGPDGLARLRAAPYGPYGLLMETTAPGYQAENRDIAGDEIREIPPALPFQDAEVRPVSFVVDMYAEPRFAVELVVPPGYRGVIRADIQIDDNAPVTPGERGFRFDVPNDGALVVKGPPTLRRVSPSDYHCRYAGGDLLPGKPDLVTVGFRWLKRDGSVNYFVVGTKNECDQARRRLAPNQAGSHIGGGQYDDEDSHSGRRGRRSH